MSRPMQPSGEPAAIIAICNDLLFASKMTATAKAIDATMRVAASYSAVGDDLASIRLAIADLSQTELTGESLAQLRKKLPPSALLVAYGSHVDAPRLAQAKASGCDLVLPRSRFVEQMSALFQAAKDGFSAKSD